MSHARYFTPIFVLALHSACTDRARDLPLAPERPLLAAAPNGELPSTNGFRKKVTADAIRAHQAALQAIATANGGTRATISPGYAASVDYVREAMIAAGYNVTVQTFPVDYSGDASPPVLARISPAPTSFVNGVDFRSMGFSGSGDVSAPVVPVDLNIPTSGLTTSGCESADFAGFPPGSIALMQRGTCEFAAKVDNALAAGAVAAIIFNEGNTADRLGVLSGTLQTPKAIPVVGTTYALGVDLATSGGTARVKVDFIQATFDSYNVIAESPKGNANDVVVVGAPLDSDDKGPGINAASGSAALLEIARAFAGQDTRNRMRFIWFGANSNGLLGSTAYVNSLAPTDLARIRAMIALPQIASPNFVRFVMDGDNSDFAAGTNVIEGPAGSGEIERLFTDYFAKSGLTSKPAALASSLDYSSFAQAGIPVGAIFSGTTGIKTAQEQLLFGGAIGTAYDPCSLLACDTFANVSLTALDEMSDAAAHVVLILSRKNFTSFP